MKDQTGTDAFLGHFNLPVTMGNIDPYCRVREEDTSYRVREEDTSYRNQMLSKTSGHLLHGSCYQ